MENYRNQQGMMTIRILSRKVGERILKAVEGGNRKGEEKGKGKERER